MVFKLSTVLIGHSLDVRGLTTTADGCIISSSRDKTAKVWEPNGSGTEFLEVATLRGHTHFVSCVCVLPPSPRYTEGLILTGSHDKKICAYSAKSFEPLFILESHKDTVCCLSPGLQPAFLLSSSWDTSAKVWNVGEQRCTLTLTGHDLTVWAVLQMANGMIATGSADRSIRVYSPDGTYLRTCTGHKDCVRALAALSVVELLSSANDSTIRKWNVDTGECLDTFHGHKHYIYSLIVSGGMMVSGGEDRAVRVWSGKQSEEILLPAQSVWAVARLPNGDVVAGSDDCVVRVFSTDPGRQADEAVLASYQQDVMGFGKAMETEQEQEIGGVKVSDLPGKEALYEPGRTDQQTKMIREGSSVICYSWSAAKAEWEKVGEVTGAQAAPGKTLYKGKNYDFVFSVDVQEGKPPLKLPYNRDEDPYKAAQEFILENHLSQQFLDQVANFIITNSKGAEPALPVTGAVDPFTGGARYIPGGGGGGSGTGGMDPFTGGNRYIPGPVNSAVNVPGVDPFTGSTRYVPNGTPPTSRLFPQTSYVRFDQCNSQAILGKLEEFNKRQAVSVPETCFQDIIKLTEVGAKANLQAVDTLKTLLTWPPEVVFPVLDLTRLAVRNADVNSCLCGKQDENELMNILKNYLVATALPTNQMLALKTMCNMMSHSQGEALVISQRQYLLHAIRQLATNKANKALQVALTTVLLNLSVAALQLKDGACQLELVATLSLILPWLPEAEALLRGLVALGTLLQQGNNLSEELSTETLDRVKSFASSTPSDPTLIKVANCSSQILDLLKLQ